MNLCSWDILRWPWNLWLVWSQESLQLPRFKSKHVCVHRRARTSGGVSNRRRWNRCFAWFAATWKRIWKTCCIMGQANSNNWSICCRLMSMKKTLHYPYHIYISSSRATSKNGEGHFFWCHNQHRIFFLTPTNTQNNTTLKSRPILISSGTRTGTSQPSVKSSGSRRQGGGGKSRGNDEGKDSGDKGESSSSALELARCRCRGWIRWDRWYPEPEGWSWTNPRHGSC